jgi:hypothetical protein
MKNIIVLLGFLFSANIYADAYDERVEQKYQSLLGLYKSPVEPKEIDKRAIARNESMLKELKAGSRAKFSDEDKSYNIFVDKINNYKEIAISKKNKFAVRDAVSGMILNVSNTEIKFNKDCDNNDLTSDCRTTNNKIVLLKESAIQCFSSVSRLVDNFNGDLYYGQMKMVKKLLRAVERDKYTFNDMLKMLDKRIKILSESDLLKSKSCK